jgi:hypothetical protein
VELLFPRYAAFPRVKGERLVWAREGHRGQGPGWRVRLSVHRYGPLAYFLGIITAVLVPLILGYIGLSEYLSSPNAAARYGHGWADIVFYDLQLLVLSAAPTQGPGPYPVPLGVARLLAPAIAGLATVGALWLLLSEQWRRWSAAGARRHCIVAGDGTVALELARRLREENRKVVLATASDDTLSVARHSGLLSVRGDPVDPGTLRAAGVARAAELYACAADSVVNAGIALRARDELPATRRRPLSAYALVRDAELVVALRARRIGAADDPRLRVDFFDVEGMAARKLLDRHPLPADGQDRASVVIVGFGQLGLAVLREIARRYPRPPAGRPIDVVIKNAAESEVAAAVHAFSAISDNLSLRYGTAAELPGSGECTVFVCLEGADHALREGLTLAHSLAGKPARIVVCLSESWPLAGVLAAPGGLIDDIVGSISTFGVIQEACLPADIRANFSEQLGRAIHDAYVAMETAKGNTEATNPSVAPWERLSSELRSSSLAQAADIGAKIDAIGAVVIPRSAAAPAFAFSDREIEILAQMEHDRWKRQRTAAGWRYGERRDDSRRLHPDLLDWASLSEEAKDKDRNAVRTLPTTLHDAGFQILRLPDNANRPIGHGASPARSAT